MRLTSRLFANVWSQIGGFFYPLEVVGRGSETQLQMGENVNYLIERCKV